MFKKPFNKKDGENRECKKCGQIFWTPKPKWQCNKCIAKYVKEQMQKTAEGIIKSGKYQGQPYKTPYPFSNKTTEANNRFARIRRELDDCWDREERRAHYDKQLKEAEELGIIQWINDRRDMDTLNKQRPKSRNQTEKDYPSTKDWYED